jgi:hypothetical protein
MPALPRQGAFWQFSAQATWQALSFRARARLALQPVLRTTRLSHTQDASLAAFSWTQGLPGGSDHSYCRHVRGRSGTDAPAQRARRCRSPQHRALAQVVARDLHGNAVLAKRACRVQTMARSSSITQRRPTLTPPPLSPGLAASPSHRQARRQA